jgi:hypothetical protein
MLVSVEDCVAELCGIAAPESPIDARWLGFAAR